jgi:hypothetical protein
MGKRREKCRCRPPRLGPSHCSFSILPSWGIAGHNLYLIDVLRRRMEYPQLKRAVRDEHARLEPDVV